MAKELPFRKGKNWLGSFSELFDSPAEFLVAGQKQYGDAFSFRLATKKVAFFAHPEQVKKITLEHAASLQKSATRSSFGESVLTSEGEPWKELRKSTQPFFQR